MMFRNIAENCIHVKSSWPSLSWKLTDNFIVIASAVAVENIGLWEKRDGEDVVNKSIPKDCWTDFEGKWKFEAISMKNSFDN